MKSATVDREKYKLKNISKTVAELKKTADKLEEAEMYLGDDIKRGPLRVLKKQDTLDNRTHYSYRIDKMDKSYNSFRKPEEKKYVAV
jgi:hypothetical protein